PRQFNDAQQIVIAAAGTVVNLLLAALALALVFLKRPPFRAAINELLIQFTWISLLNALVVYPVLDLISGINGDWTQMYSFSVPSLSLAILVIHVVILGTLLWAWRSASMRARVARLTGGAPGFRRMGTARRATGARDAGTSPAEQTLRDAATRVASGWPAPVEAAVQNGRHGAALVLSWGDGALRRSVIAAAPENGGIEFSGALRPDGLAPEQRPLGRDPGALDADRLTMMLRLAMETVEGWTPSADVGSRTTDVGRLE
ncbi:MAG: hypothetical protein H0T18_06375, partial [Chloroflexia bacterium]|nr:hypothetical protein [Chloroflexia bacterium]